MTLRLFYHPFASFCQKVLIAFYEKGIAFERVEIDLSDPEQREALKRVWPLAKFPVLRDEERDLTIPESGVIIEYLDRLSPEGPRMIPADPDAAMRARIWERFFDNYVAVQLTKIVIDRIRPEDRRDPQGVEEARALLATAYGILETEIGESRWAAGAEFSLADCAAAPALFYANTAVPIDGHPRLSGYYERLLDRDSFRRVVKEARPYRHLFPLPWPESYV